jgi:hypothetical protein
MQEYVEESNFVFNRHHAVELYSGVAVNLRREFAFQATCYVDALRLTFGNEFYVTSWPSIFVHIDEMAKTNMRIYDYRRIPGLICVQTVIP